LILYWYDYGARFYDPVIARWHVQDPMAEEYYSWSTYQYVRNNPIILKDPNGMSDDWFQNELTGDVYFNSELKQGDEAQLGEGWVHLGENGMFSGGNLAKSDLGILAKNENLTESGASIKIEDGSFTTEATLRGENAETFMNNQGYMKVPTQATQKLETTIIEGGSGTVGQIKVSNTRIVSQSIEKVGFVPKNNEIIGSYRLSTPKPGSPIVGVGVSTETVQYRFEYGQRSKFIKALDFAIKVAGINTGNFDTSRK